MIEFKVTKSYSKIKICLFCVSAMLLAMFMLSSCDDKTINAGTTAPDLTTVTEPVETEKVDKTLSMLLKDNQSQYVIVVSADADDYTKDSATSFKNYISELFKAEFIIQSDETEQNEEQLEILFGYTSREQAKKAYENLSYNEYRISVDDKGNINIAAWSAATLKKAYSKLAIEMEKMIDEEGNYAIKESLDFSAVDTSMLSDDVPVFSSEISQTVYYCQGYKGAYEIYIKDCEKNDFDVYLSQLVTCGYTEEQNFENDDFCSSVYMNNDIEITVTYWKTTGEMLTVVNKMTYEAPLQSVETLAVTTPKLISVGLEYEGAENGECYIIQASDGSYIIVDGAEGEAFLLDRIYQLLCDNLPTGETKPHICAWFLSHQHSDHMNGIINFAKSQYASLVTVDAIYTNMPAAAYQTAYSNYSTRYNYMTNAADLFGADFVIARTGQTYYFADIQVLIFETADDMIVPLFDDLDNTSVMMSVSVGGKKMNFSGDAGPNEMNNWVLKRYTAATIKCDYCQASSHGEAAVPSAYYELANPSFYVWPATLDFYGRHTPSSYILNDTNAQVVMAYDGTRIFNLVP